jgi:hypothetical protein
MKPCWAESAGKRAFDVTVVGLCCDAGSWTSCRSFGPWRDVVADLLWHAGVSSSQVYVHPDPVD